MTVGETARMLVGSTLGVHIILAVMGVGFPVFITASEYLGLRHGDPAYLELARRASKAFTVLFAVGAVTGTLVAAELAIAWAPFMVFASQVIILPFFIEGFAFVLESMLIGMYLYGWDRFKNPWAHWWLGIPIIVASAASGLLITAVNAWMNSPAGFRVVDGRPVDVQPWVAFFNPSLPVESAHVLFMSYTTVSFLLLAAAAWALVRQPNHPYFLKAARLTAVIGTIAIALTVFTGDASGKYLAAHQPEKLAAAEGLFKTTAYAPWAFFGIVDVSTRHLLYAINIPDLLSWLSFGSISHPVLGLDHFAPSTWPPTTIVHLTFDTMVTLGTALLMLGAYYCWRLLKGPAPRWLNRVMVWGGPAVLVTMECGWLTDEFGRQPWVIYHIMPTADGLTRSASIIPIGFTIMGLLVLLACSVPFVLWRMFRTSPLPPIIPDDGDKSTGASA